MRDETCGGEGEHSGGDVRLFGLAMRKAAWKKEVRRGWGGGKGVEIN